MAKADPHVDIVETAAEVLPRIRELLATADYVIRVGVPGECRTCSETRELRLGHCFDCAVKADPESPERARFAMRSK